MFKGQQIHNWIYMHIYRHKNVITYFGGTFYTYSINNKNQLKLFFSVNNEQYEKPFDILGEK